MRPTVYLAGPISGLSGRVATRWREHARIKVRAATSDPLRGKDYLLNRDKIPQMLNQSMSTSNAIVTRDKFDVTHAAMLLCNFLGAQKVSIGTVWEIGVATAHAIPYVVVMEPDNIHRHPMVTNNAYAVLEDLEEAIRLVNLFLAPYLESQNGSE